MISKSAEETINAGKDFAKGLNAGDIVLLYGELGSGKTQFVKGIAEYFKVKDIITSPTFIIVNEYTGENGITIYHTDLYRIKNERELEEIGFQDYINPDSIMIVEWPEKAMRFLDSNLKKIYFYHGSKESIREINFVMN
jgi:tRNA threonylcarbamoyladenosine biosynthesis protein TsaE